LYYKIHKNFSYISIQGIRKPNTLTTHKLGFAFKRCLVNVSFYSFLIGIIWDNIRVL